MIDFNPFGKKTDSLLYSWDELNSEELTGGNIDHKSDKLELRVIDTESGVQPSDTSMYGCPLESFAMQNLVYSDLAQLVQNVGQHFPSFYSYHLILYEFILNIECQFT